MYLRSPELLTLCSSHFSQPPTTQKKNIPTILGMMFEKFSFVLMFCPRSHFFLLHFTALPRCIYGAFLLSPVNSTLLVNSTLGGHIHISVWVCFFSSTKYTICSVSLNSGDNCGKVLLHQQKDHQIFHGSQHLHGLELPWKTSVNTLYLSLHFLHE